MVPTRTHVRTRRAVWQPSSSPAADDRREPAPSWTADWHCGPAVGTGSQDAERTGWTGWDRADHGWGIPHDDGDAPASTGRQAGARPGSAGAAAGCGGDDR